MTDNPIDPEWSLLLAACSVVPPEQKRDRLLELLRHPVRWQRLLALADYHRVQPLLCQALCGFEQAIPHDQIRTLKEDERANLHKALLLSRELIRIVAHLSALGLKVMPYKGPALAELLYGDIAMRPPGDIDLLVRRRDLARIRVAVGGLGYIPHLRLTPREEQAYLSSGYELAFDGDAGPNLLELQWAIQPRFYAVNFDIDGVFQRAVTLNVAGHAMATPSPADLFLILSLHAAKHVWGRLVWLCDIAQLMMTPDLDWNWIGSQAQELGIVRILRVTMLAANEFLGAAVPSAAQQALPEDRAAPALLQQIQAHIVSETPFNVDSLAYFRLTIQLRERQADRLRFLTRLVFTPGPSEWAAVRLPELLFPMYPLVRLSRLAAKMVRA